MMKNRTPAQSRLARIVRGEVWSTFAITFALLGTPLHAQFVYLADAQDEVWGYTISPATGALTAIAGSPFPGGAGAGAISVAVDPNGRFAYVASYAPDTITGYTINPATGALTVITGSPFATGNSPSSMAVEPSGKFAYVTNFGDNNLSGYTINPATGALSAIAGSPFAAGKSPQFVMVDPGGNFVYVTNLGDNTISGYSINPASGKLTAIAGSPFATGSLPYSVAVDPSVSSPLWPIPTPIMFRGTRSTRSPGRSRPSPFHPLLQEKRHTLWQWTRAATSPKW